MSQCIHLGMTSSLAGGSAGRHARGSSRMCGTRSHHWLVGVRLGMWLGMTLGRLLGLAVGDALSRVLGKKIPHPSCSLLDAAAAAVVAAVVC